LAGRCDLSGGLQHTTGRQIFRQLGCVETNGQGAPIGVAWEQGDPCPRREQERDDVEHQRYHQYPDSGKGLVLNVVGDRERSYSETGQAEEPYQGLPSPGR
jgi:hypothetical protein